MNKIFFIINCILFYFIILQNDHNIDLTPENSFKYATRICQYFTKLHGHYKDVSGEDVKREQEYDFIVVGGGNAGSVVANRLSEEEGWKVLLLEAGIYESFVTDIPLISAHLQLTDYNWNYSTEPQTNACWAMEEKRCKWPRGKALGGTSSINHMIYTRGSKLDYDIWAQLGNHGWSYDDVLPYFMKSQNMDFLDKNSSKYHSTGGYLNVEKVPFHTPLAQAFLDGAEELGYKIGDYNGEDQLTFSTIQATMRKGSRCSASKAFLMPIQHRTNLHISTDSRVTKLVINTQTKQVTGVEFVKEGVFYRVNIRKEVIISAAALNSPQLLMLSGIGPKDHLIEMGIPLIKDLKVGDNLQDHVGFLGLTFLVNDTVALNAARLRSLLPVTQYFLNGSGPLTVPAGLEALGYLRTKFARDERPDIELIFVSGSLNTDDGITRQINAMTPQFYETLYKPIMNVDAWTIFPLLLLPKSVGSVRLRDKNPFNSPIFLPNYLSDPHDVATMIEGMKIALQLAETLPFRRYDAKLSNISVPECGGRRFGSDKYWACALKYLTGMGQHQSGTCKMGPVSDGGAVVDPMLRVYGVKGLRVADTSVIPTIPTAHTNAVAYMIGEKASDLVKGFWKLD